MYCPSCGIQSSPDQKFCRSCGMDMLMISQAVAAHIDQMIETSETRHEKFERWGKITGLIGITAVMLLIVSVFVSVSISKIFGISLDAFRFDLVFPLTFAIAFPLMVIGAGLISYPKIIKEPSKVGAAKPTKRGQTTAKLGLPNLDEAMPSITEKTTELLDTDNEAARGKGKEQLQV